MRISDTIHDSIVDGPGLRFVVFTQGCPHNCPGCHNQDALDPEGGREVSPEEIIADMRSNPLLDGLTLSGGEPFFQPEDSAKIARAARETGLDVWCYSGWTFDELIKMPRATELLRELDVLIDGPFILPQRSLTLKWRGSENQRIIDVKRSLALGKAQSI